eukprot:383969-Pyramimonas_sp.AAC.1
MFPQVSQVKQELLKSWSYLGVAFKDSDSAAIKVFSTYRTEDSVALNEDPTPHRELPDEWFVNEKTALIVAVEWECAMKACNFKINDPNVDGHNVGSNSKQNISSGRGPRGSMGDKKDKKDKIPASKDKMQPMQPQSQSKKDFED